MNVKGLGNATTNSKPSHGGDHKTYEVMTSTLVNQGFL